MRSILASLLALAPIASFAQTVDATAAAAPSAGSPLASMLPLVLIFFVFYFLLIKPQQKRMKQHQATLSALKKGDDVVTGGGIIGKITKVTDGNDQVTVKIAEGVEVSVLKATLSGLVTPAKAVVADKKKTGGNKNDNVLPSRDSVANDN